MFNVVYITFANQEDAQRISMQLVQEQLVACANIFPIRSAYWWNDMIHTEDEWVALVKTTVELWPTLRARVEEIHPYEIPCIMKFEVEANEGYEDWVRNETEGVHRIKGSKDQSRGGD
jgi:periplasmic divalent cation tolerance protein